MPTREVKVFCYNVTTSGASDFNLELRAPVARLDIPVPGDYLCDSAGHVYRIITASLSQNEIRELTVTPIYTTEAPVAGRDAVCVAPTGQLGLALPSASNTTAEMDALLDWFNSKRIDDAPHVHKYATTVDLQASTTHGEGDLAAVGVVLYRRSEGTWTVWEDSSIEQHLHELSEVTGLASALAGKEAAGTAASAVSVHNLAADHSQLHSHPNATALSGVTGAGDGSQYLANDGTYKTPQAVITTHGGLSGRDATDAHPTAAITGLDAALSAKAPTTHTHASGDITDLRRTVFALTTAFRR